MAARYPPVVSLDVVARAEPGASWEVVSQRCARAVRPGIWRPLEGGAAIDLGPADPIMLEHREGAVVAHARTTPWGPGYHERVVEVLERLGDALPGGWREVRDGAGYWETRRRTALCKRFLSWAHHLWTDALERGGAQVGLAAEAPLEVPVGLVATATGYKDPAWIQSTRLALGHALSSRRPDRPARAARGAFLWWCREPDAFDWAQLGRALCATDVIWRPIVGGDDDPDQQAARLRALECFEAALRADPGAPVPVAEMNRLYELTGREGAVERAAPGLFWGGYREDWIRLPIGRWTIAVPGWLRGAVAGDGHDVFWDDEMTVHVSVGRTTRAEFSPRAEAARLVGRLDPAERARARVEVLENDVTRGYAVVVPAAGQPDDEDALIQGLVAHEGDRVGYTVVARSSAARALGLRFGRYLRPA